MSGADPYAAFASPAPASAPPSDPYAAFASPAGGTGEDVAKSVASGIPTGIAATAAAPAVLPKAGADALVAGGDWVARKALGLGAPSKETTDKQERAESEAAFGFPDVGQLAGKGLGALQSAIGYTPQTTAGRYAQNVAEFAPGAVIGPGGPIRKMLGDVVAPAVASETAGHMAEGKPYEGAVRFAAGLGANTASAGSRYLGNVPAQAVTHALGDTTPAQLDAARTVQATGARIGVPLSGPEAIQYATSGATKLGDLLRFTEGTQRGGAVTAPFFAQRPGQITTAGNAALDAIAPASTTPSMLGPQAAQLAERSIDGVRQGINDATRPAYAAAEQHVVPAAEFDPIARQPAFQESLRRLREDPVLGPQYANHPDNSGAVIDAVTKDMGARSTALGNAANPGYQPQTAAAYASGADDARGILRDPARGGTQAYDDALTMQEQARRQNLEPLEAGALGRVAKSATTQQAYEALLPSKPLTGSQYDIGRTVGTLAHQDPVVAATLLRQGLADRLDQATMRLMSGPNQGGGAKFAKDIAGTEQQRANLDAALGALPNAAPARASLNDLVDAFQATGYRRAPGSNTAADTGMRQELSVAPLPVEALKAVKTLGFSIPGAVAERSHNFWLNRRAGTLGELFVAPDSVDQIAAMTARAGEMPFQAAGARSMLAPSTIGELYLRPQLADEDHRRYAGGR